MNTKYFTTEAYAASARAQAWRDALSGIVLTGSAEPNDGPSRASISSFFSPTGVLFARIHASPTAFSFVRKQSVEDVWLAYHWEGRCMLSRLAESIDAVAGDVSYGTADENLFLSFAEPFVLSLIRIPYKLIAPRLLTPGTLRLGILPARSHLGTVIGALVSSMTDTLRTLEPAHLPAIELSILEFALTLFVESESLNVSSALTRTQASELLRVAQIIEVRLPDQELSLNDVAETQNWSPRYVQKLFEGIGDTFTHYVRARRLEKCRRDLIDPLYSHLSITDILFRWGFNDAAHFSRIFRTQFGKSPREYRQALNDDRIAGDVDRISRGWPGGSRRPEARETLAWLTGYPALRDSEQPGNADVANKYLAVGSKTVHWGFFSRSLRPVLEAGSGDIVTVETLTHHAYDDYERMIKGDSGAEDVFFWTTEQKNVDRRGAGPMDASIYRRGAGEGFGVHICTGPIFIRDAQPGDVVEIRILDIRPRLSGNAQYAGRAFGSNAAAWWGLQYNELLSEPKPREVITIYEIDCTGDSSVARAAYSFRWVPQTDPFGVVHRTIDYPGVPVNHATTEKNYDVLHGVRIPIHPHFGLIALAPREAEIVDSVPPSYFGGNIDNRRAGKGASVYLPVSVPGALLSIGDPHAAQGDSELCGTAIECSLTGVFQLILHKKGAPKAAFLADLNYPLLETAQEWVIHGFSYPNYLAELGENAQSEIYKKSSLDLAMRDAFRKTRRFLMALGLKEDEAISLMSVAVDFGVTQVVDGNWCIHSVVRKALFEGDRSE
jgi:acetamidase/formamidase/AraC-like DNA-binding protein